MKKCKYTVLLPNGKEIEFLANFGIVEETPEIRGILDNLKKYPIEILETLESNNIDQNLEQDISNLAELLAEDNPIKLSKIENIIKENLKTPDTIIDIINSEIVQLGDINSIEEAIRASINRGLITNETINALSKKVTPKYFKGLETLNVIGRSSIRDEIKRINTSISVNKNEGFDASIEENVKQFLIGIKNIIGYESMTLLPINTKVNENNCLNTGDISFFRQGDNLSLFLALFKKVASLLPKETLQDALNIKEDVNTEEFFNGSFDDTNNFIEGKFHDLFKSRSFTKDINKIITLVDTMITTNGNKKSLFKQMRFLFSHLNPSTYGLGFFTEQQAQEKIRLAESKQEKDLKNILKATRTVRLKENINLNFSQKKVIDKNLYNLSQKRITIGQDLVKFKADWSTSGSVYGVVTNIFPAKDGVRFSGAIINNIGQIVELYETFTEKVEYKKLENDIQETDPLTEVDDKNTALFTNNDGFSEDVIKTYVSNGSILNGKAVVIGVHPGALTIMQLSGKKEISELTNYKLIKSFTSKKLQDDFINLESIDIRKFTPIIGNGHPIGQLLSPGDVFKDSENKYKRVIYTDDDFVYSYIKKDSQFILKPFPKESIYIGSADTFEKIKLKELEEISKDIIQSSKRSMNFSRFKSESLARTGDFFMYKDGNKQIIGKIVNSEANKGIVISGGIIKVVSYLGKDSDFFTSRDISSQYSLNIYRANNWDITLKADNEISELSQEVIYIIPEQFKNEDLILLQSNYANIGRYIDTNTPIPEGFIDATYKILNLMKDNDIDVSNKKLYTTIKFKGVKNSYKRNLGNLNEVYYFNNLSTEEKYSLGILLPGVYFKIQGSSDIYRVISEDKGVIIAHINTINDVGKLITIEKHFTEEQLLSDPEKGISTIFLQYGNKNFDKIINATKKEKTIEEISDVVKRDRIISKFSIIFDELNIPIKIENDSDNLVKARITVVEEAPQIIINNQVGKTEDVVHEFLHLFLMPLRYTDADLYYKVLNSTNNNTINDENSINEKEELFVKEVSKSISGNSQMLDTIDSPETFIKALLTTIKLINPNFDSFDLSQYNPWDILTQNLYDILDIDLSNSHKMYDYNMVITEPSIRQWIDENGITLKCN